MADDKDEELDTLSKSKLWIIAPIMKRMGEINERNLSKVKELVERNRYALLKNHYLVLHDYEPLINAILKRAFFLNPCPLCTERARITIEPEMLNYDITVACTNCGLFAIPKTCGKAMGVLLLDAISVWNSYDMDNDYSQDMFLDVETGKEDETSHLDPSLS